MSTVTMPYTVDSTMPPNPPPAIPSNWRTIPRPVDTLPTNESREFLSPTDKASRRESRLGLRNFFARTRSVRYSDSPLALNQQPPAPASKSNRDSITQGIPYNILPPGRPTPKNASRPLSTTFEDAEASPEPSVPAPSIKQPKRKVTPTDAAAKVHAASWAAAPLHKAYPQAVRHTTLPATTADADTVLRIHDKANPTSGVDANGMPKRRHRAKSGPSLDIDWTSKTYLLVNSGYLLEYAGEGYFDRQPEKALRLTKDSAVFASDIIPGRPWVLQIVSTMSSDLVAAANANKSFLSKFTFLSPTDKDKRSPTTSQPAFNLANNMLLVLESPEELDEWLATLRRVIEALGGKRTMSETGDPWAEEDDVAPLREQPSQRTLVVGEGNSFSTDDLALDESPQPAWEREFVRRGSDAMSELQRDESMDDTSATNSILSHDGQRLESLRSSANNRYSCVSSGQRTVITSAGSSPAGSPNRECFLASPEEPAPQPRPDAESRLRPNAAAIVDRRKSQQVMLPFVELQPAPAPRRPQSSAMGLTPGLLDPKMTDTRRFSTRLQNDTLPGLAPPPEIESVASRRPPTALQITRPLSMVEDQPSPKEEMPERPATRHGETPSPREAEFVPLPQSRPGSTVPPASIDDTISSRVTRSPPNKQPSPRRLSSMGALRMHSNGTWFKVTTPDEPYADTTRATPLRQGPQMRAQEPARCHSSMDMYGRASEQSPGTKRRVSMMPFMADRASQDGSRSVFGSRLPPPAPPPSKPPPAPPLASSASSVVSSRSSIRLRPGSSTSSLLRKSMPQLTEGPPPAPAPTCALPPVPAAASSLPPLQGPPPKGALPPLPVSAAASTCSLPLVSPPPPRGLPPLPPMPPPKGALPPVPTKNNMI